MKHVFHRQASPCSYISLCQHILSRQASYRSNALHTAASVVPKVTIMLLELLGKVGCEPHQGISLTRMCPQLNAVFGSEPVQSYHSQWQLALGPSCFVVKPESCFQSLQAFLPRSASLVSTLRSQMREDGPPDLANLIQQNAQVHSMHVITSDHGPFEMRSKGQSWEKSKGRYSAPKVATDAFLHVSHEPCVVSGCCNPWSLQRKVEP